MLKKKVAAFILTAAVACPLVLVSAATIPASGTTNITPNKLTIKWEDNRKAAVTIDTFRFFDYNIAQLRTMVGALDGVIAPVSGGAYQLKPSGTAVAFSDIKFSTAREIQYIINQTQIQDKDGKAVTPAQPGWVYLPENQYNWGSIRDVAAALGIELVSVVDGNNGTEVTVKAAAGSTTAKPGSTLDAGPAVNPPSNGTIYSGTSSTSTTYAVVIPPTTSTSTTTQVTTSSTTTTAAPIASDAYLEYTFLMNYIADGTFAQTLSDLGLAKYLPSILVPSYDFKPTTDSAIVSKFNADLREMFEIWDDQYAAYDLKLPPYTP